MVHPLVLPQHYSYPRTFAKGQFSGKQQRWIVMRITGELRPARFCAYSFCVGNFGSTV
jgi:hypothetical protein